MIGISRTCKILVTNQHCVAKRGRLCFYTCLSFCSQLRGWCLVRGGSDQSGGTPPSHPHPDQAPIAEIRSCASWYPFYWNAFLFTSKGPFTRDDNNVLFLSSCVNSYIINIANHPSLMMSKLQKSVSLLSSANGP